MRSGLSNIQWNLKHGCISRWYGFKISTEGPAPSQVIRTIFRYKVNSDIITGDWDPDGFGFGYIADFRRGKDRYHPEIENGDVYEIVTSDPKKYPLPSFDFLQIQYAVIVAFAALKAAGSLKTIFSEDPPDVDPVVADVPYKWEILLQSAEEAGILDTATRGKWANAFAREAQMEEEERIADLKRTAEEMGMKWDD